MTDGPAGVRTLWQGLRDAILSTPDGNAVLDELRQNPDRAATTLEAWVEAHRDRVAPEVSAVVLGGSVGRLVQIARADVVNVYQPTLSATLERQLRGIRERHRLFAGRESELEHLNDVLASGDSRVVLVTGGPGRGKSALLASWISSLQGRSDIACCYSFISRADETATQDFTARALCQQMLALRGESSALPPNADELVALYLELVASEPARGRPMAVVIDGVDEAVGWSPGKLIPMRLPPRTVIVCSARAIADRDWVEELGLHEALVVRISLAPLSVADIGAMLRAAGDQAAELAGDPAFVSAVHAASGGEPSHVRFLAEDVEAGRVASVADVARQPVGLRAYFDRWWRELAAEPLSGPVRDLLAYLHVARGPIGRHDLVAISGSDALDSFSVDAAIRRVERYVAGTRDDGYAIAQPRFREYMTEHWLVRSDLDPYRVALCDYCAGGARLDSMYALRHLVEHLDDLGQHAAIIALARDDGYLHAQRQRLPEEPERPLAVTRLAIGRAADAHDGAAMAELALRHAGRSGAALPWPSPLELAEDGRVTASWTCADYREPELAVLWHLLVAWHVGDGGDPELAAATVARLEGRPITRLAEWRGPSHIRLLAHQPEDADASVATIAAALLDEPKRYLLCVELMERGRLQLVRAVAETIDDERLRAPIAGMVARSDAGVADLLVESIGDPFVSALSHLLVAAAVPGERAEEVRSRYGATAQLLLRCPVTMEVIGGLGIVAANQALLDDAGGARATLDASEPLAIELPPGLERGVGLGLLAAAWLRLGDRQGCDRLIAVVRNEGQRTNDPEERSRMLATVALQLAFAGGVESAISLGEEIPDEPIAADLHGWMAVVLANDGAVDVAARLAALAEGASTHDLALHALAAAQARAGSFEQARETASAITDAAAATRACISIAESAVQQVDLDEAEIAYLAARSAATSVSDGEAALIALVLASSARAFAPVADSMVEPALAAAGRLEDPEARGAALGGVAAALATAGRTEEAASIVETIPDAGERVRAWAKLGDVHARAGRADEARRAFAAAFKAEETVSREWARERGRTRRDQTVAEIVDTECDRAAFPQARDHALRVLDPERRAQLLVTVARRQAASGDVEGVASTLRLAWEAAEAVEEGEVPRVAPGDPRDLWVDRPDADFGVPEPSVPFPAPQLRRPGWSVQVGRWRPVLRRRRPGDSAASVAVTYAELGLIGDGLALARTLSGADSVARGLAGVARFQMAIGDARSAGETSDEAVRLADSLQGPERVRVLSDVGYTTRQWRAILVVGAPSSPPRWRRRCESKEEAMGTRTAATI